jgi:regulator of protease activity HflC (stomatin/prohibitin superfamily)
MAAQHTDAQALNRGGRGTALAGLAVQLLLAVAAAATAAWSRSDALGAVAWHMLGGVPIWLILAIIYGQFEVEHREALAAEKMASGDAAAAVLFGDVSDELQRARARLTNLLHVGLPLVSVLVGGYLAGIGGLLLWRFGDLWWEAVGLRPAIGGQPVGLLFATGSIAFVAFVAGRWISGCARIPAWRLLRGGASYLMSCFVVAALAAVAAAVTAVAEDTRFFGLVAAVIPAIMILVGAEILITCLLEVYRPRQPGHVPRPAFDSRLLGMLTTPESLGDVLGELIRYQFGVEVSGSWLFRLLGRAVTPLTLLAGGVLAALSCLVVVGPDEEGLILRLGAIYGTPRSAGVHFKLPWPIETATVHPTRRIQHLRVSSGLADRRREDDAILWTSGDDRLGRIGAEYYPAVLAAGVGTGGLAVIDAEIVVQYRIQDLPTFLATSPDPEAMIAVTTQQEAGQFFASHDLEYLLSKGRMAAGPVLARAIQARLDDLRLGIGVVDVSITALQPPAGAVARAFHQQIAAQQEGETIVERARRDAVATLSQVGGSVALARRLDEAILQLDALRSAGQTDGDGHDASRLATAEAEIDRLLAEARGEAAELIHAARGDRWTLAAAERTAHERFAADLLAHERAPRYYRAARFLDILAAGLADRRKYVVSGAATELPVLKMDFADPASAIETLLGE